MSDSDNILVRALKCQTKEEAALLIKEYLPSIMEAKNCDAKEALRIANSNIGYFAGYYDLEDRQRV